MCDKLQVPPWPPTRDMLEAFAAYLRSSGAYKAPQAYWWAIIQRACEMGDFCAFDKAWADGMVAGLKRNMQEHEQTTPLTIPVLHQLAAAVVTEADFVLLLSLVAAIFCVARADCFLHLRRDDIVDVRVDRVKVNLHDLKGQKCKRTLAPVFRRPAALLPLCAFADCACWVGAVSCVRLPPPPLQSEGLACGVYCTVQERHLQNNMEDDQRLVHQGRHCSARARS